MNEIAKVVNGSIYLGNLYDVYDDLLVILPKAFISTFSAVRRDTCQLGYGGKTTLL